jgi:hypothetical protein
MKKKAERRVRQLIRKDGFAQPDEVEYGPSSVTLFWHSVQKSILVDVDENGEVGESRMGPRSPSWDNPASSPNGRKRCFVPRASLQQKRIARDKVLAKLADQGLPDPDEIEFVDSSVTLLWHDTRLRMVVHVPESPPG